MKTQMKLLGDVRYCIKVDYFMCNIETDEEYTQPCYLSIDTETKDKYGNSPNLIIFKDEITEFLRVFDSKDEASEYMNSRISNPCYCENPRVIKIKYNFEAKEWEDDEDEIND